jgi:VanZ family protein
MDGSPDRDDLSMSAPTAIPSSRWLLAATAYALLIVYASLFPLSGWTQAAHPFAWLLWPSAATSLPRADLIVNVLAYVPLGLAIAVASSPPRSRLIGIGLAVCVGFALSFGVETVQSYLPSRVSSASDLLANTLGSLLGAMFALLIGPDSRIGGKLARLRREWIEAGRVADIGLVAVGLWTLSQLSPLLPSFDVGNLRQGIAPLVRVLAGERAFNSPQFAEYVFAVAAVALMSCLLIRSGKPKWLTTVALILAVLLLKIPVVSRQLSLEAVTGALAGVAIATPLMRSRVSIVVWSAIALIAASVATAALAPGAGARPSAMNWTPFGAHLANPLIGVNAILAVSWSAFAVAWLARQVTRAGRAALTGWIGGVVLFLSVLALEYAQQSIPGRVGDVTSPLIAAAAWAVAWRLLARAPAPESAAVTASRQPTLRRHWFARTAGLTGLLMLGGAVRWVTNRPPGEEKVDRELMPKLPAPDELAVPSLPGFRNAHPRLPAPTARDIATLRSINPAFVDDRLKEARGGQGPFWACAFSELATPGSQDLEVLCGRLTALQFTWRGHEQGRPLALVYDWLHEFWTPAQRQALQDKLVEGCDYLTKRIREDLLSPYNVILYNSPFQALMACTLAIYRDDPRADRFMAFTHDLWKNRVLPVWRQVMGRNGGWHEGCEYVGIGIGQAIYQVPAMWRSATGEDLFRTEPGIRGFLDFLLHRTQPDGSHLRLGDGAYFDRIVTDAPALALEFGHVAAYNLRPPRRNEPVGWPWGRIADDSLRDARAAVAEPLSRLFDGIGLLVARNRWSKDATHVSFKAGDNFWSHVHLDQGAFTIHRGAPLALDSGVYGPRYGSDHHMNYSYQTVAHNTITVSDPDDNVPAPALSDKDKPRPIANDGGQRRIGSGWGVERAPLDLGEWQAKRSIYHTGRMVSSLDSNGIAAALADITPAYTNELSGKRTFSHRTRRVERAWRFFAYDMLDDYVVIYDDVRSTKADFQKRWLLHSILEPQISGRRFLVRVPPQPTLRREGGELEGHVLLPRRPMLHALGGRGLEFFVDGRNYDENGTLWERLKNRQNDPFRPEPGSWRIELSPETASREDQFLVVLVPSDYGSSRPHEVRLIEEPGRIGVLVAGPSRTTRWWFTPGTLAARVEVASSNAAERASVFDLRGP